MLADEEYRARVVRQVRDPFVRAFWTDEFAQYDARFQREAIAPIQNKLGQFLSPTMRNIVGQVGSKIDLRFMMDHGRVFIANLAKGRLGEEPANLLGALLVAQFQHAAMTRAEIPEESRRDFHLFIDEFHNFTTSSLATSLAETRKYRLSLTLAHQYIDQLTPETRAAVFGNVGTVVAFRVGAVDAKILAADFGQEFTPEQFADLSNYEVFVRTLTNGVPNVPFRAVTLPPMNRRHQKRKQLINRSREKYATSRVRVEEKLLRWLPRSHHDKLTGYAKTSIRTHPDDSESPTDRKRR
jgi:hypothetical protein